MAALLPPDGEDKNSTRYECDTDPFARRGTLAQKDEGKYRDQDKTEFVDRSDL
jgi:hypothetical protein